MTNLRALIFDVDGTMADTEKDGHRVAFNHTFAQAGLDWEWSPQLYGELLTIAGGKERMRFYLEHYRPDFQPPDDLEAFIANLHAAKTDYYRQLLATGGIPLRPGVKRLLKEAHEQGIRLAIATTSAPANVTALLESTLASDGPDWFEAIAAGDIVPAKKPAPDIYHHVLQTMELGPQECLAIEDSHHGLMAARQANLKTVITVNSYTRGHDFSDAALVLNHLGEPDQPFTVVTGDVAGATYFDIALARHLHSN